MYTGDICVFCSHFTVCFNVAAVLLHVINDVVLMMVRETN